MSEKSYLIIGLGNPGAKYAEHRHNVGFMLIDALKQHYGESDVENKFGGELSIINTEQHKLFLLKPLQYMNNSGNPTRECKSFYKIPLSNCIVIHDDLDLDFMRIKVKIGGGTGGHNGLKSIDQNIGKNYIRLRFGIGRPTYQQQTHNYVLSNFTIDEKKQLKLYIAAIMQNFHLIINGDYDKFMSNMAIYQTELKKRWDSNVE